MIADVVPPPTERPAYAPGMTDLARDAPDARKRIAIMTKSTRSRAERKFAASRRKEKDFLNDLEDARRARTEQIARLRALRLARDAASKELPSKATTGKTATGKDR